LAAILANEAGITDPTVICAALLHDTIEDTETTADELLQQFGQDIASIVMEVTDDKSLPKNERKQRQIDHAASLSPDAKLVKLADKISNLRDIAATPPKGWDIQRKREYFDWSKAVVDRMRGAHSALEALFDVAASARPSSETPSSAPEPKSPTSASSPIPNLPHIKAAPPEEYGKAYVIGGVRSPPRPKP
jgi:guanosine-3',5'-bis(diphosphate) 3'-pyrophosphohydrolase